MIVGPPFTGKIYLILKKPKHIFDREIFNIKRFPEQYIDEFDTEQEVRDISEYKGCIVVFDGMLVYNQTAIDPIYYEEDINFKKVLFITT